MRVRFSNRIALTDVTSGAVAGPLMWAITAQWWWVPLLWALFLPTVGPLWLNREGHQRLARVWSIVYGAPAVAVMAYIIGPECGIEWFFVINLSAASILLPRSERWHAAVIGTSLCWLASVFVARLAWPTAGALSVAYQTYVSWVVLGLVISNVVSHVTTLIEEGEARGALLQRARNEALAASEAKSSFLANMSHELRTPLGGVIGLTDLVLDGELPDDARTMMGASQRSARHLMEVLNGVLDLAKIESGELTLESRDFELVQCISEAASIVRLKAEEKGLKLVVLAPRRPDWRRGDALRLKQVVVNLLGNAVKFTDHGSVSLRLSTHPDEDEVVLEVVDTGVGMSPEQCVDVFRPFRQADVSTARTHGGTGLGLTITRQLVQAFGGTIGCVSELGVGTRFTVSVPLGRGQPPAALSGPRRPRRTGLSVLVAEDNAINRMVVQRMLERLGHHATVVDNGRLVVERALAGRWDIILMDMQMPEMDGLQATETLRDEGYAGPILALTANALSTDAERCLAAGMDDVLIKPIELDALGAALQRVCEADAASAG